MNNTENPGKKIIGITIVVLFVLVFLAIGGQSAELSCEHTRTVGTINCIMESRLFWVIPLGKRSIQNVQGAQVTESSTAEGDAVYRVELLTAQGAIPMNAVYTSGSSTKSGVAEKINSFVTQADEKTLVVTEPGLLSLENLICMVIWLPIALFLNFVWGEIKSAFGRSKENSIKTG